MTLVGKIGLVVANGDLPSQEVLASLLSYHPYILAADGGANQLLEHGIVPDAVLGDFDSVDESLPVFIERIPAPDQNFTDLDKSVNYLRELGCQTIWIVGATGDRLDHTYGALSVLVKYSKLLQIVLVDNVGTSRPVEGTVSFEVSIGQTISLLALGSVTSITTSGLRWNLDNETLEPGVRDGISNEAISGEVSVTVGSGALIVYVHHG